MTGRAAAGLVAMTAALAGGGLSGCISDPEELGLPPMCEQSSDCDQAAGEVCEEGVCWGDPPDNARFAALLWPPADRADLPLAVVPLLSIARDGEMSGLEFPEAVAVRGRVLLACPAADPPPYTCGPDVSVGAQILIERTAAFPGGPEYSRTVAATAGNGPGKDSFVFLLPRDPDAEYRITIQPEDSVGGDDTAPGEIAPPRQLLIRADRDRQVDWVIGEPAELKVIRGCVENVVGDGKPYAGMKVVAFGRWTDLSPLERASSRSVTGPDGCFELSVPRKMLDEFDITVQPMTGVVLPSFALRGEFVRDPGEGEQASVHVIDPPLVMPLAPAPTTFRLPVVARGTGGGPERVVGADVRFTTEFAPPSLNQERRVEISFAAQAVTSGTEADEGMAVVELYPGDESNRTYRVTVIAPTGSPFQSVFDHEVTVGIGGAEVLQALSLEQRTAVTGVVLQANGDAVVEAPMEARPSALFRQLLDQAALEKTVAELPFPTATTDVNGGFLLWLDGSLVGKAASYDIDVTPPISTGAPSWSIDDVELDGAGDSLDLGPWMLPEASFARGTVKDAAGNPVAGAELHVYQLAPDNYCSNQMKLDPADCEPSAKLRDVWLSDEAGTIRVVLPDP